MPQKPLRKAYRHNSKAFKHWLDQEYPVIAKRAKQEPELNPDEYLNCDLKSVVYSGISARTKNQLKCKTISHLRKFQKLPGRVRKYFKHPKITDPVESLAIELLC